MRCLVFSVLFAVLSVQATPLIPRQDITPLSNSQIVSFRPYTYFASAAYCQPSTTSWNCGANCKADPGFIQVASGGNGDTVQFWYVGFSRSLGSVIVAHQGTNRSKLGPFITNVNVVLEPLNPDLFPGVPSSIEVHAGFANEHAKTAVGVLSTVQNTLSMFEAKHVTVVGHSLGGALALLDAVYLRLHLDADISVDAISYGMPRVGNQEFANYVDAKIKVTHINNKEDPIPTTPIRLLGYHHTSGEIHIDKSGQWNSCSGQDNPSTSCSVGAVPLLGNITDHGGPYDGIAMRC